MSKSVPPFSWWPLVLPIIVIVLGTAVLVGYQHFLPHTTVTPSLPGLKPNPPAALTALPVEPPPDFLISWTSGGGMSPVSTSIEITATGGSEETFDDGISKKYLFDVTPDDFKSVYALLRAQAADQIETEDLTVYDGENNSYSLYWSGQSVHVWGLQVTAADRDRFAMIYTGIKNFVNTKTLHEVVAH